VFSSTVANVSAQNCTINPRSPSNLTVTGGVLTDGTQNVMIGCECVDDKEKRVGDVRWFFPNTTVVARQSDAPDGAPYRNNNNRLQILVIPTFNDSYDGTYTCGVSKNDKHPPSPMTNITLTLEGEKYHMLFINYVNFV